MVSWPTFRNPPIEEALLDVRTLLPANINLEKLEKFQEGIRDRYPTKQQRIEVQGSFQLNAGRPPEMGPSSLKQVGYLFLSSDSNKVVQARLDGFSFSKLRPYESWQSLHEEARSLWNHFIKVAEPKMVTRVSLRYINKIEIKLPINDLDDYLITHPVMAPGLPENFSEFFMRIVMPVPESNATAIVLMATEPARAGSNKITLIFDIDAFYQTSLDPRAEELWTRLETLRDLKNNIFFRSTTEKAKELFR